jgi:hypothetical protein
MGVLDIIVRLLDQFEIIALPVGMLYEYAAGGDALRVLYYMYWSTYFVDTEQMNVSCIPDAEYVCGASQSG